MLWGFEPLTFWFPGQQPTVTICAITFVCRCKLEILLNAMNVHMDVNKHYKNRWMDKASLIHHDPDKAIPKDV